jgi:tetrahydromethanopterin S-methyltransferase subunit C
MLTRDSRSLKALQIAAVVLGIMANTIGDPTHYGLTDTAVHWISLLSVIIGTVSGILGTSPLPGDRSNYVTPPKDLP